MRGIKPGKYRHRVEIQEPLSSRDPNSGEDIITWSTVALSSSVILNAVPAQVLTGPGREFRESAATQNEISARINMRWFPGLTQKMRIIWDSQVFNIEGFDLDETGRHEYRVQCSTGVNDGE